MSNKSTFSAVKKQRSVNRAAINPSEERRVSSPLQTVDVPSILAAEIAELRKRLDAAGQGLGWEGLSLKNRSAVAFMFGGYTGRDGTANQLVLDHYGEMAA